MPNPAARRARRIDRPRRRSSACAGRFCRRTCAIAPAGRGLRAGPAQAAAAPPALARRAFWIPFVPAKAGTQSLALDSRLRGNERDYALASDNTPSFPRRVFCARGFHRCFTHPESRGGRSAEKRSGAQRNTRGARRNAACQALARRLAPHDAGRSPLGAPPWRFWAPGAALPSPSAPAVLQRRAGAFGSVQRAPRTQVVVPGGRGPCLPRRTVTSRRRRTPLPAPPSGSSPETPLNERGCESCSMHSICSQERSYDVAMENGLVMAGLVPAIHVFAAAGEARRGCRHKAGHDELRAGDDAGIAPHK